MSTPPYVADFDSATGLVRGLAAALAGRPYRRLGRSRATAGLVRASRLLPERVSTAAFARAGAHEGIRPDALPSVDPERFCRWVVDRYGPRRVDAVAVGSSNGAAMHLCAATGAPWLPQTFLVPVRRRADPDDCVGDAHLAEGPSRALLDAQPGLAIHQMHDPNQDRLMVRRIAYFRMKMRTLTEAYRRYLHDCLAPGGTIVVIDGDIRWPVTRRADRHVYQQGAVGGLTPQEYVEGGPRVESFLREQAAGIRGWRFPPVTELAPEAEWGYEPSLTGDLQEFADRHGYRVARLRFDAPDALGPVVADVYRDWYARSGTSPSRLLAETFICVEPTWALATRTVPLWLSFGTEPALETFVKYLGDGARFDQVALTLFAHGVRSAGYAAPDRWQQAAAHHDIPATLAGVDRGSWPADFATLAAYADALYDLAPPGDLPELLTLSEAAAAVERFGPARGVEWTWT
ncbi:MAG TPA: hypothetical protein VHE57_13935 [Mycobacteriales bacterium]|nr:hypothetical protein [Mycobacteriales bacterium]